ncbi:nucleotidyltransferase family protein [Acidicapsa ligni]|uniref:nucleotidyltransferase family protein n=1 Tax=Acidicapsa ligni TaxID=542300 RepID=UPI0021E0C7F7|nr:nucleotidyltransferase domain-containing protein [Acidicapsa ligni]
MRPSEALLLHRDTICQLVLEAGMGNPRVFGSVVRGEDNEESDLDILVDPGPRTGLLTMVKVQDDLARVTGVKVDLHSVGELHPRFRDKALARRHRYE